MSEQLQKQEVIPNPVSTPGALINPCAVAKVSSGGVVEEIDQALQSTGMVDIVYGASDQTMPLAGQTVKDVREATESIFNIPTDAKTYIAGEVVEENYVLKTGDRLEFLKEAGQKG